MASPSHRTSASASVTNLAPPEGSPINKQRRMTSPSLPPPPSPLNLPEPVYGHRRPPSPLRNGFTADLNDEDESESGSEESMNGHQWGERPQSPSASVTQFAANIAQKMGSLMSNMSQRSPNYLPTDEELEAEAEREREKSRREAERILSREAESKRLEQRVLAMLDSPHGSPGALPPPPPIGEARSSTPPSPSNSQKESWWAVAKSKLTPTKEPLTPAQQIIQEAKQREKEIEKEKRELEREKKELEREMKKNARRHDKSKSAQWPSSPEDKFQDPAFIQLHTAVPHPRPITGSPVSPSPARIPVPSTPPSLLPSPLRAPTLGSASPSRQSTPLYAVFNSQGSLDVPATLITIAQRFEKLEKWTVSHTRALEERMDDVERWLVDKEGEKDGNQKPVEALRTGDLPPADVLNEIREELAEVQGRIGELGREMAKMVTAPGNLSSGPSRHPAGLGRAPSASSSIAVRSISANLGSNARGSTPPKTKEPTTSPTTSPPVRSASRTRLPYPTGDYATPPDSVILGQGPFSPPHSPPSSASKGARMSISGLPYGEDPSSSTSPSSGLPIRVASPTTLTTPTSTQRQSSVSPTPRKRYTVALGEPIMNAQERSRERSQPGELATAVFSSSPKSLSISTHEMDDDDSYYAMTNDETIGKAAARQAGLNIPNKMQSQERLNSVSPSLSPKPIHKRVRPQSMYNGSASAQNLAAPSPTTPKHSRLRSRSTDRFGLGIFDTVSSSSSGRFVDPLVIRKQTKEALASTAPAPPKVLPGKPKVPVGQLVAFFDQEK
ncbi:unnamed protein product [Somion occarium]|uniref:Uncharacterized protein n=1 Tax=Somion occarium TaxID=3059160 RepID=A0ABP1DQA2_9APHY